jgi:hypothetical protein
MVLGYEYLGISDHTKFLRIEHGLGAAVQGPGGGTAVVRTVPSGARALAIAGVTYYVASGVYYKPVYQGSEVVYQQVPPPEGQ